MLHHLSQRWKGDDARLLRLRPFKLCTIHDHLRAVSLCMHAYFYRREFENNMVILFEITEHICCISLRVKNTIYQKNVSQYIYIINGR
jgi:hypothetical protein